MRKRTLNQTWTLCLRMWRWIAKVWQTPHYKRYGVYQLKKIWRKKTVFTLYDVNVFFCDYTVVEVCDECPGNLVDSNFDLIE